MKTIVLWTKWFGDEKWSEFWNLGSHFISLGLNTHCYLTTSRRYLPKSSAVVFHGRDFLFSDLPQIRYPWQYWVFYLLEAPINSHFETRHWLVADTIGFNWTMSYRPSSDVYAPYVYVKEQKNPNVDNVKLLTSKFVEHFKKKPKMAIWLSSNCE